jgi:hypothetical protein
MLVINSVIFTFSSIRLVIYQSYFFLSISIGLFLLMILIVFAKKIPFLIRSYVGCTIFYCVGVFLFFKFGPLSSSLFWFFLFSVFSASFNGVKGAVYANTLTGITMLCFILLLPVYDYGWQYIKAGFYTSNVWWLAGASLFFLNLVLSSSIAFFMNNLEKAILRNINSRNAIIFGLANLTEFRDNDTGKHLERISKYSLLLARELRKTYKYKHYITDDYLDDLEISSILHDIGKVGIEDKILFKTSKLTEAEFERIKMHPVIGSQVIKNINLKMHDKYFLNLAQQIILYHHEKYDGSGYPEGLKADHIPLSARIVALADVYDALITERVYKKAFSHKKAVSIMLKEKGRHFDPVIVNVFKKIHREFEKISKELA